MKLIRKGKDNSLKESKQIEKHSILRKIKITSLLIICIFVIILGILFMCGNTDIKNTILGIGAKTTKWENGSSEDGEVYSVYMLINELDVDNGSNLSGCKLSFSDNPDLELSFINPVSGNIINENNDGTVTVPENGLKLKIDGIALGSSYEIEIESKEVPENYISKFKKATIVVDATTEIVTCNVKEIVQLVDGEEQTTSGSIENVAIFMYQEQNGKLALIGNEEVEIYYYYADKNGKTEEELNEVEWSTYNREQGIDLEKNGIIYAKSKYKNGSFSKITHLDINNIDKLVPSVEVLSVVENSTRDEAIIKIKMQDQEETADYSKSDIYGYAITKQEIEPTSFVEADEEIVDIAEVTDNGTYYVWVRDKAGNVSHISVEVNVITYIEEDNVAIILSAPDTSLIGTEYTSINTLINTLEENGITQTSGEVVIQLVKNIKNEAVEINNENIILDLNGYTLTNRLQESAIDVQSGSLKIVDDKYNPSDYIENDELVNSIKSKYSASDNFGKVYSLNYIAIEVQDGATLTLGQDNSTGFTYIEYPNHDTPIIEGSMVGMINHGGTVNYYDGVILGRITIDGEITNTPSLYSPVVVETDDENIQKTVLERVAAVEAMIGKTRYTKLETAIEAANNIKGTPEDQIEIDIVTDITKDFSLVLDETKNIKLDLNGFTITNTVADYVIKNSGKLEIVDSTVTEEDNTIVHGKIISNTSGTIFNYSEGQLILTTGGIETTFSEGYAINNLGITKINGGNVKGVTYGIYNYSKEYLIEEALDTGEDYANEVLGEMISANNYFFVKENDTYIPNNGGIGNSSANSYFKIDLSDMSDKIFVVSINASMSSEKNYDYGYATIKATNDVTPQYNDIEGRFINISGEVDSTDYNYILQGGNVYYLYLGYRKDGSGNTGLDRVTFNNIKVYGINYKKENTKVEINGGKVESRNTNGNSYAITNYANLKVTNGIVCAYASKNANGVYNDSSEIDITGGTFIGDTSNSYPPYDKESGGIYDVSPYDTYINGGIFQDGESGIVTKNLGVTNISNVTIKNCKYGILNCSEKYDDVEKCVVVSNFEISECIYGIYNYSSGNIKIENGFISNSNSNNTLYGIYNNQNGIIHSNNTNISINTSNSGYGVYNYKNGVIEFDGGIINVTGKNDRKIGIYNESNGSILMYKGEIVVDSPSAVGIYNEDSGIVKIGTKDGNVNNNDIKITSQNNFSNSSSTVYAIYNYKGLGKIDIYEGTFIASTEAIYGNISDIEENYYIVLENIDEGEKATIGNQSGIAYVEPDESVLYDDIQDAIDACNGNGTVVLVQDSTIVNNQAKIILENENINLNFNGKKIKTYGTAIKNYGELSMTDMTEDTSGRLYGYGANMIINEYSGKLNYDKINVENILENGRAIYNNGEFNLNGGTIKITGKSGYSIYNENKIGQGEEVSGVLGEIINAGEYYFEEQSGKYVSNNQGKKATANSYMKIDLSDKEGVYIVTINAAISSRINNDYGYATIRETNEVIPTYNDTLGRFIYISGEVDNTDYSYILQGGKEYYLYLGYRKQSTSSLGEDQFKINSIKVNETSAVANINGGTISAICDGAGNSYGIYNDSAIVNITEGKIDVKKSSRIYGISNYEGKVNIEGGEINTEVGYNCSGYAIYNDGDGEVYINEGIINLTKTDIYGGGYGIYNNGLGYIKKSGGTISLKSANSGYVYGMYNNDAGTIELTGGNVVFDETRGYDYGIYNNGIGTIEISNGNIIFDKMSSGYNYGLYNYSTGKINMTGGRIYINNTYTTSGTPSTWIYGTYNKGAGEVRIEQGSIEIKSNYYNCAGIYNETNGVITLGTKDNQVDLDKVVVKASTTYTLNSAYGVYQSSAGSLKFYDGVVEGQEGKSIYGVISDYEEGYNVVIYKTGEINEYEISEGQEISILDNVYVAHLGSNNTDYNSIYEAIENSADTDVITILSDFSINENLGTIIIDVEKDITIDLNGYTINGNKDSIIQNNGKLKIKDSRENGMINSTSDVGKVIYNNGELNLESGTIKTTGKSGYGIYNENKIGQGEEVSGVLGEIINAGEYYFEEQSGKYVSNNQGKNATANSYMKIDLSDKEGVYIVAINAAISSRINNDYGYATIRETNEVIPTYNDKLGRFIYISGEVDNTDYGYTLQGGREYYLYLGYRKSSTASSGEDQFKINSIKVNEISAVANICGGTVSAICNDSDNLYGIYNDSAIVNVTRGKIETTKRNGMGYGIKNYKGIINVDGGEINLEHNAFGNPAGGFGIYNDEGKVYKNGGTINITNIGRYGECYGIYNNGTGYIKKSGGTINLKGEYTVYGMYNNDVGTIELTGGDIVSNETNGRMHGIYNNGIGTIEISNGNIIFDKMSSGYNYGLYNYSTGKINMTGGRIYINNTYTTSGTPSTWIYGTYNKGAGEVRIEQGSIEIKSNYYNCAGIYNETNGVITLGTKDNQVDLDKVVVKASTTYTLNSAYGVYQKASGSLKFYDGVVEGQEEKSIYGVISDYEEGYNAVIYKTGEINEYEVDEGQEISILENRYIAHLESNNTDYNSIYEAIENSADTDTIKVLYNIFVKDIGPIEIQENKDITIDLNGYTINGNIDSIIQNNGKLKIKDSRENGMINSTSDVGKVIYNNGELNLESGTIKTTVKSGYGIYNENKIGQGEEVSGVLGEIINAGEYYFEEQSGKYVSNNQGKNATANSYMKIDLSDKEGVYIVAINAAISSRINNDYGYATIRETNDVIPAYNDTLGRFIYISGEVDNKDYGYTLQGGREYYLYLGYRKSSTSSSGEDKLIINSIKVNETSAIANINGGTISAICDVGGNAYGIYNDSAIVNVTEGKIDVKQSYDRMYGISNYKGIVNIDGGEINTEVGYNCSGYAIYNDGDGKVYINEGIINLTKTAIYGGGYGIYNNGLGYIKKSGGTISLKSGNSEYVYGMYNNDAGTIELTGGNVVFDETSGYSYGLYNYSTGKINMTGGRIYINNTFTNSGTSSTWISGIYNNTTGNITVEQGDIEIRSNHFNVAAIYNKSTGTITIGKLDDDIPIEATPTLLASTTSTVNCAYGIFDNGSGTINFYDGTARGTTKAIIGEIANVPAGYYLAIEDNEKLAILEKISDFENKICVNGRFYESFQTAIDSITNSVNKKATIVVWDDMADITDEIIIPEGVDITIALEGHILKFQDLIYAIENNGILKIVDYEDVEESGSETLSIIKNEAGTVIKNNGTLTIGQVDNGNSNSPQIEGRQAIFGNDPEVLSGVLISTEYENGNNTNSINPGTRSIKLNNKSLKNTSKSGMNQNLSTEVDINANPSLPEYTNDKVNIELESDVIGVLNLYSKEDKIREYKIEYYYDGLKDANKTETLSAEYGTSINTYPDKNIRGYKLDKVESLPLTVNPNEEENLIKVYYIKDTFNYTIEYYYDGVIDNSMTETLSAEFGTSISTYPDKITTGYMFDKVETIPLVISENELSNLLKVYYKTDPSQTKTLSYTVEYYKDNVKVDEDTIVKSETVQVLEPNTLTLDRNLINDNDKYYGYKLNNTDPTNVPDTVNNGDVIKVYYTIDPTQTKTLSYTVEYYKENVKVNEDTMVKSETVQVLEPGTLTLDRTLINNNDKYDGYRLNNTEPETVPDIVNNGDVIKVYYVKRTDLSYTIHYKEQGTNNTLSTDKVVTNQTFGEEILESAIDITGYDKVAPTETNITITTGSNEHTFYYTKGLFNYTVEYYYDGVKDDSKTDIIEAVYKDEITTYTDKVMTGYILQKVDEIPLIISENESNNIIKVYYITDTNQTKTLTYTVEYYKDNIKMTEDTIITTNTVQVLQPDTLTFNRSLINNNDKYDGYRLNNTEPATVPDIVNNGDVIKVYYVKRTDLSYTIHYKEQGSNNTLSTDKVVTNQTFGENILESAIDITGYDKVAPTETNIAITTGSNEYTFYYKKAKFNYTVEYYYNGVKDDSKTDVIEAVYQDRIETYTDKVMTGYMLDRVETIPLVISANEESNFIKVYYKTDPTQTKTLSYTVEYYKDNVKVNEDTIVKSETVQVLEPDTLTLDRNLINDNDKYYGYKLNNTDPTNVPDTVNNGDVIKVYYTIDPTQTKTLSYTVEYYKDNIKMTEDTIITTNTVQVLEPDTLTFNRGLINNNDKYNGYRLNSTNPTTVPDIVNNGDVIKVYYVKRTDLSYTIHYKEQGSNNTLSTDKVVTNQTFGEEILESAIDITGYDKVAPTETNITITTGSNEYTFYYKKAKFNYTVEYYYNGVKDDSKTDVIEAVYQDRIETYTDKVMTGYMLDRVETIPLVVSENESNNIIKVYYKTDPTQTKTLSYTVEYYKDNVKVNEDTIVKSETVQVLEPDTLTLDRNLINDNDKYYGYKLNNTDPTNVPDTVNNGDVIKVYYLIDPTQTKTISYTVEYYKDNVKVNEDTIVKSETVQILEPDTITLDRNLINDNDKYYGYKLNNTDPTNVPDTVNNGDVIKVYYTIDPTQTKTLSYTVEYYRDNVKVNEDTIIDSNTVQVLEPDTITLNRSLINNDKYNGYRLNSTNPTTVPDIVNNGDVIKVYYVKRTDLSYTIHYKEQGSNNTLSTDKVVTNQTYGDDILESAIDITGYDKVAPIETNIAITTGSNEYTFYYKKAKFNYTVEYYYNGVKDDSKTDIIEAVYKDEITRYTDKVMTGYIFDRVETIPLVVSENESNNIIKVYYKKDSTQTKTISYTVEYYKDNVKVNEDTIVKSETVQVLEPNTLTLDRNLINDNDKYYGYKLSNTEPTTVADVVNNGDVIKVYYLIDPTQTKTISYTVEYYKDNVKVDEDTAVKSETVQVLEPDTLILDRSLVNNNDKYNGYRLNSTNPTTVPDIVNDGDLIKVYYIKDSSQTKTISYTVEYYKDNVIVDDDTMEVTQTVHILDSDIINLDKSLINNDKYEGYRLNSTDPTNVPETVNNGDVIKVYYVKRTDLSYTIHYKEQGTDNVISADKVVTNQTFGDEVVESAIDITGYDKVAPTETNISITLGTNEYTFYYTKGLFNYTVEYYYDGIKDDSKTEIEEAVYQDEIVTYKDKLMTGYKLDKVENIPLVVGPNEEENLIKVYYIKDSDQTKTLKYTIEYYKDDVLQENDIVEISTKVQVLEDEIIEVDKSVINTIDRYDGYTFEKVDPEIIPDTIENGGVIKVYYIKTKYPYRIEYYYDDVIDDTATVIGEAYKDDEINQFDAKLKDGYEFDKVENLPMIISSIEENVIKVYYYTIRTIIVNHIDKNTDEILDREEYRGKLGNTITTTEEDIPEYICVEKPDVEEHTYGEDEQIVNYYYAKVSDGVIEKHIDEQTASIIYEEHHSGEIGKKYNIEPKEIESYVLNDNRLPDNAEGEMTDKLIEVRYYYNKETKVVVHYIYKEREKEIEIEQEEIPGYVSKEYEAQRKDLDGYVYDSSSDNITGTMSENVIDVYFYYKKPAKVIVRFIDVITNEEIEIPKDIPGNIGDNYNTTEKAIEDYVLIKDTQNTIGTMGEETTEVIYYYSPKATVSAKYVDKDTGEDIATKEILDGYIGKDYTTDEKEVPGYTFVSNTKNIAGKMTEKETEVIYYYSKQIEKAYSKYIINYIDADTGKPIKESKEIDKQEVETKIYTKSLVIDIDNYTFKNANTDYFVVKENEDTIINLYYSKNETAKEKEPTVVNIKIKDDTPSNNVKDTTNVKNANNEKPTKDQVRVSNTGKTSYIHTILGIAFIVTGIVLIGKNRIYNKRRNNS